MIGTKTVVGSGGALGPSPVSIPSPVDPSGTWDTLSETVDDCRACLFGASLKLSVEATPAGRTGSAVDVGLDSESKILSEEVVDVGHLAMGIFSPTSCEGTRTVLLKPVDGCKVLEMDEVADIGLSGLRIANGLGNTISSVEAPDLGRLSKLSGATGGAGSRDVGSEAVGFEVVGSGVAS